MTHRIFPLLLAAFLVLPWSGRAGTLQGTVLGADGGAPVADATITLGDHAVATDAQGRFRIEGSGPVVKLRAPGYRATSVPAATFAAPGGAVTLQPFRPKALYLTVYGIGYAPLRDKALALVRDASLNALVVDLKGDRGLVDYPSAAPDLPAAARRLTSIPDLAALARDLHERGLYAIGRIVVFKDDPLATARPDLAVKRADGSLFRDREHLAWTDPFQPEVRRYNVALAVEAAAAGFDEIQFDYLRFPDSSERLRFAKPVDRASRVAAIAGFLAEARKALIPYNVFLAADIFGYVCWNLDDTGIGQQLDTILQQVDYLSPMLYPSGFQFGIPGYRDPVAHPYEIVRLSLDRARQRLGVPALRFRPWLQAFRDYAFDRRAFAADEVKAQIRAADAFGSDGWMLWDPSNRYAGTGLVPETAAADPDACS